MKFIIFALLGIMVFAGYMGVTSSQRIPAKEETSPKGWDGVLTQLAKSQQQLEASQKILESIKKPEEQKGEPPRDSEEDDADYEDVPPTNYSVERYIEEVFGPEKDIAIAVARAESGMNPSAINVNRDGSKDVGIFQINDTHGYSEEDRLDPETNIRIAKELR